jgi:hypothetical protein
MITMTERGGFCRIIAPTCTDFNAEVRKLFPQAEIGTSDGQHTLTRIRIPSGLRGVLAELIDKYYTLDGEVRPYVKPDWDYMDSVTPEPRDSQSYYEAWKRRQGVYGRPQETIWGEAAERAQDVLNEKRFSSEWERVMEAYGGLRQLAELTGGSGLRHRSRGDRTRSRDPVCSAR